MVRAVGKERLVLDLSCRYGQKHILPATSSNAFDPPFLESNGALWMASCDVAMLATSPNAFCTLDF